MIDLLASEPQYADHLVPVWQQLPGARFWVTTPSLARQLEVRGVEARIVRQLERPTLTASILDHHRARRLGAPALAYMEHGCGQSYGGDPRTARASAYAGGRGRENAELILAPNEFAAQRWREAYPGKPVHVIGTTRPLWPPRHPDQPLLAVSFHAESGNHEQRNAWSHYRLALPGLARELPMIGHAHPRFAHIARRWLERHGIPFVADLEEVAARATVYAVDNSSTLWELGRTRPTIALNAPWYRRDVRHGLRFWSHAGRSVDGPEELLEAARQLLAWEKSEDRSDRERICREVIPSLDGAERAARLLTAWSNSWSEGMLGAGSEAERPSAAVQRAVPGS